MFLLIGAFWNTSQKWHEKITCWLDFLYVSRIQLACEILFLNSPSCSDWTFSVFTVELMLYYCIFSLALTGIYTHKNQRVHVGSFVLPADPHVPSALQDSSAPCCQPGLCHPASVFGRRSAEDTGMALLWPAGWHPLQDHSLCCALLAGHFLGKQLQFSSEDGTGA